MPVGGISWYEAMAYAEFAGKSLPTVYEWFGAAGIVGPQSGILTLSNFGGRGPAKVGANRGMASIRDVRHGRQPEGMDGESPGRSALFARRRVERRRLCVYAAATRDRRFPEKPPLDSAASAD